MKLYILPAAGDSTPYRGSGERAARTMVYVATRGRSTAFSSEVAPFTASPTTGQATGTERRTPDTSSVRWTASTYRPFTSRICTLTCPSSVALCAPYRVPHASPERRNDGRVRHGRSACAGAAATGFLDDRHCARQHRPRRTSMCRSQPADSGSRATTTAGRLRSVRGDFGRHVNGQRTHEHQCEDAEHRSTQAHRSTPSHGPADANAPRRQKHASGTCNAPSPGASRGCPFNPGIGPAMR